MKIVLDILADCAILFAVMRNRMKDQHIDWLNAQAPAAPVEGHDGFRVDSREMDGSIPADAVEELCGWADERIRDAQDAMDVDEDFGWFGDEALCGE